MLREFFVDVDKKPKVENTTECRIAQRACDFFDFWAIFASLTLLFSIPTCARI